MPKTFIQSQTYLSRSYERKLARTHSPSFWKRPKRYDKIGPEIWELSQEAKKVVTKGRAKKRNQVEKKLSVIN